MPTLQNGISNQQPGVLGSQLPAQIAATSLQLSREFVSGGNLWWYPAVGRALPWAFDDLTGDLGDDLYEKMSVDPQIVACLNIFKAGILEDGITLAPAIDDSTDPEYTLATSIVDEAEAMLDNLQTALDDVLWEMLGSIAFGSKVSELVFELQPGVTENRPMLHLVAMKPKPRHATVFVVDAYVNVLGMLVRLPGQAMPYLGQAVIDPKVNPPADFLPRQKFAISTFRPVNGDPRGSALDPETPIPTPDGWRRIDDLQPGDKVFDEEGRIRYVVARKDWEDRPCYELTFRGGDAIIADENHQWQTHLAYERYQKRDPKVRTTKEIAGTLRNEHYSGVRTQNGVGRANHSIPWAKALDYPEQLLPVHPYYFGLWLGDGTGATANISCHVNDLDETIALIGAAGYTARASVNGRSDNGRLIHVGGAKQWDSSGPSHALRLLGVQRDGDNVDCKHIPAAYLRGSIQQRRDLLAGLMDADGSVDRDGRCEFSNTNRQLAEGVQELARSLGVPSGIRLHHAAHVGADGHTRKDAWGVFFTPPWSPFKLARKAAKTINVRTQNKHYIIDAKPVANRRTVCIETDGPSHLYLAGRSMVPTHNSILRAAYDPWWRKRQILPEYLKFLSQFAGPSIIGFTPPDAQTQPATDDYGNLLLDVNGQPILPTTPEQAMLSQLVQLRNGTAAVFPGGAAIHPLMMTGDGVAFLKALAECNVSITKAILTQELATEEGEHMSRAAASVHQDVLGTLVRQAKRGILRMFTKDILKPWVIYNWGDKAIHLVPVPSLGEAQQQDLGPMITALAAAGYQVSPSMLPDIDAMLNLPVRDMDADLALEPDNGLMPEGQTGGGASPTPPSSAEPGSGSPPTAPAPVTAPSANRSPVVPPVPPGRIAVRGHTRGVRIVSPITAKMSSDLVKPRGRPLPKPAASVRYTAADLRALAKAWDESLPDQAGLLKATIQQSKRGS